MQGKCELILIAPPGRGREALRFGLPVAHAAYRVGGGPHLFRANPPLPARGGLMAVDCAGFDGRGEPGSFCQEVLRECAARGFTGVLCDFQGPPLPLLVRLLQALEEPLARRGWPLYVPEAYGPHTSRTRVLLSSALSGGSLELRLREGLERYGPERTVLAVERTGADFFLPAPSGQGAPLTREELARLLEERAPSVFFSSELCARYFTYMADGQGAHFVLFDDAGSIRRKLRLAARLGVPRAVLPYAQLDDLLEDLLNEP